MARIWDAPQWKRGEHFDQCYAVIERGIERNDLAIVRHYVEWITVNLGEPFATMMAWAIQNGFPDIATVRRYGGR